ncbi:oxidoreductase with iron-sulfur subunit [Pseudooceanicola batsensis HTCC2597]|uniref:Oxidoreductase with iron-sulfur subunit n=1 Tax=Pseudooceanicola batsensis (strain ATCC BAA-863 / DSM 15984 / KCTC 12145 / HTCC2597) TaxID=252305 RepID=A3U0T9_PSEBH|nr:(2Fe-2S)-binding protein [Pseudooceanicola batsensis]EAQ02380.1 oxidoreductase with iron-sulfur subunit [Pseudooceanicola batsensis HTCC2597]
MPDDLIRFTLNGRRIAVPSTRGHLGDLLRHELGETGTHIGCEHGVCGACNVVMDGRVTRSCLTLAVQVDGAEIETIEHAGNDRCGAALQDAFVARNAFQCGYCTPGMIMTARELLSENAAPGRAEIRDAISGNLCRCTGYQAIVEAISDAAEALRETADD